MILDITFPSFNERDTVYGWIYTPTVEPKGIIQIVHGFCEHSRRYMRMITAFVDAGYVVSADDHVGTGKTASVSENWSDWGDKGWHTQMEDEHTLTQITKEKFPNLSYFLFGHSMGSFIIRDYIATYGSEISGAVLCGTSGVFRTTQTVIEALEPVLAGGHGVERNLEYTDLLMGWMNERCSEPITYGNEWSCADSQVLKDFANDPYSASTPCTNRCLYDIACMMNGIIGTEWAEKVPTTLPILNIAGDQDPVGDYGTGVYQTSNWLIETGHTVRTHIYPGYRHEIHMYREIRDDVIQEILSFIETQL